MPIEWRDGEKNKIVTDIYTHVTERNIVTYDHQKSVTFKKKILCVIRCENSTNVSYFREYSF